MPERARAFLVDDDAVSRHAALHAGRRPTLPRPAPVPARDTSEVETGAKLPAHPDSPRSAPETPQDPETALWTALREAGPQGATVGRLMAACGMGRSWVYARLRQHADAGRAVQLARGKWRAANAGHHQRGTTSPGTTQRARRSRDRSQQRPPNRDGK